MSNPNQYEKLFPDILPIGYCFNMEVRDAGEIYNQENGMKLYKPGEYVQFYLHDRTKHIWIMRIACFRDGIRYGVAFGPEGGRYGKRIGDLLTLEQLKTAIQRYLDGKIFQEVDDGY